jgi:hypothetical protein
MKKLFLIPALFLCLCIGLPSMAGASGYSMAIGVLDDDGTGALILCKFRNNDFLQSEVDSLANQLSQAVQAYGYGNNVLIFNHALLGDPDALRSALSPLYKYYETMFLEISKGPAPVASAMSPNNIWIDISYENIGQMYVGTFGFQEWILQMEIE